MEPTTVLLIVVAILTALILAVVAWYEHQAKRAARRLIDQRAEHLGSFDLLHRLHDLEAQRGDVWDQSRDLYRETMLATGFDPDLDWQGCRQRRVELDELIDGPPRPLAGPAPRNVIARTHDRKD